MVNPEALVFWRRIVKLFEYRTAGKVQAGSIKSIQYEVLGIYLSGCVGDQRSLVDAPQLDFEPRHTH